MTKVAKLKDWHNTMCVDFDGVVAEFGNEREGQLVEGVVDGLARLIVAGWYIDVFSGRSATIPGRRYLLEYFKVRLSALERYIESGQITFPDNKPVAKIYLDDRGMTFRDWDSITPEICAGFRTWWQHPDSTD